MLRLYWRCMKKRIMSAMFSVLFVLVAAAFSEVYCYNFIYHELYAVIDALKSGSRRDIEIFAPVYGRSENFDDYDLLNTRNDDTILYDKNKRPVLFLGCSYTYGQGITVDKTFSSLVKKLTGRKTDNIGVMGGQPDGNLSNVITMHKRNLLKENNYELAVYTWMYNHLLRVNPIHLVEYLTVIRKENKDKSAKDKLLYYLDKCYSFKLYEIRRFLFFESNKYAYHKYCIRKMYSQLREDIPDIRFVFLIYNDNPGFEDSSFASLERKNWEEFEKDGIEVIETKSLTGDVLFKDEYKLAFDPFQDPHHPNEKAWALIVPPFCKKLDL